MMIRALFGIALASLFIVNCAGESPNEPDSESAAVSEESPGETQQALLVSCESYDGAACSRKGQSMPCDNGTPEGGFCFCNGRTFFCE